MQGTRVANQFARWQFVFDSHDRKFRRSLGNERTLTVHYPDDGLGIGAIRMPQSGGNLFNNIIGKASGMGENNSLQC